MHDYNQKTIRSNQLHQLLITPSKHFSISDEGILQYQKELLKISLKKIDECNFKPIVHFILRDKFSGVFYAETVLRDEFPGITEFLHRAWSLKKTYNFAGLPESLSVPSYAVSSKLSLLLENLDVVEIQPQFNTEAGVRVIRIIESELIKYSGCLFKKVQNEFDKILREVNHIRIPDQTLKSENYDGVWLQSIENVILPPALPIMKKATVCDCNLKAKLLTKSKKEFADI